MIVAKAVVTTPSNGPIRQIGFMTRTSVRIERFLACFLTCNRPVSLISLAAGTVKNRTYRSLTVPSTVSNTATADPPNDCVIWKTTCIRTGSNPGGGLRDES
jgi:hypothetical protein